MCVSSGFNPNLIEKFEQKRLFFTSHIWFIACIIMFLWCNIINKTPSTPSIPISPTPNTLLPPFILHPLPESPIKNYSSFKQHGHTNGSPTGEGSWHSPSCTQWAHDVHPFHETLSFSSVTKMGGSTSLQIQQHSSASGLCPLIWAIILSCVVGSVISQPPTTRPIVFILLRSSCTLASRNNPSLSQKNCSSARRFSCALGFRPNCPCWLLFCPRPAALLYNVLAVACWWKGAYWEDRIVIYEWHLSDTFAVCIRFFFVQWIVWLQQSAVSNSRLLSLQLCDLSWNRIPQYSLECLNHHKRCYLVLCKGSPQASDQAPHLSIYHGHIRLHFYIIGCSGCGNCMFRQVLLPCLNGTLRVC